MIPITKYRRLDDIILSRDRISPVNKVAIG
jgi:hypothetical protein